MNRTIVLIAAGFLSLSGCSHPLAYRIIQRDNAGPIEVSPLRLEVTPVDTAELDKAHPFCWRGDVMAGFMLFDVKVSNASGRDVLCLMGHRDFPGLAGPRVTVQQQTVGSGQGNGLVGSDQLVLSELGHERASILTLDGYRFEILDYGDFSQRYARMMRHEMSRAGAWNYVPTVGSFIASHEMKKASENMDQRQFRAEQKVLRPGVVPAGSSVRGYLVFAWPEDIQPGEITLRMPVQPAHTATARFDVVRVEQER